MEKGKGFQTVSLEMVHLIKKTHKYTTKPWTSVHGITYIGFGQQVKTEIDKITKKKAEEMLNKELTNIAKNISSDLGKDIPQHIFDVFCHIAYDFNVKGLKNSSIYLLFKQGNLKSDEVSHIMKWSKIKGNPSSAMMYRRTHDVNIFLLQKYEVDTK